MTLSRKIVIGLSAGIACGLFFGEICGGLSIIGTVATRSYLGWFFARPDNQVNVIMSGIATSPSQFLEVAFTRSYIELNPALVVPDHLRSETDTVEELLRMKRLRIGVVNDETILRLIERRLPRADAVPISRVADFFEAETPPADGLIISAEAGSAWTLLYPEFQVVLPFRNVTAWPLGYATARGDTEFLRFLDLWVELKRDGGFVSNLRDHWILGRTAVPRSPRWSVIRDVLHWVE